MPDPIVIDLNQIEPDPEFEKLPEHSRDLSPDRRLGFRLTPMDPSQSQAMPEGAYPGGQPPELHGRLESHRITALQPHPLSWQAAEDQFHIGGPPASLDAEEIVWSKDIYLRPSAIVTIWTYLFNEYPEVSVTLEMAASTRTPADAWLQFFCGNGMVGKIFLGRDRRTHRQEFRFVGTRLPHQSYNLITRLATEAPAPHWGYFRFKGAEISVRGSEKDK